MDIQISVIIVNFNTSKLLENCLKSVFNDAYQLSVETIVVDNDSRDDSTEMVKQLFPEVILIENTKNTGFAAANNQGLKQAKGKYIWLLNPDTIVFPGCMPILLDFMETTPEAGAVSPRTWLDEDKTLEVCSLKLLTPERARQLFTKLPDAHRKHTLKSIWELDAKLWKATSPTPVEGIGGAAFFTTRALLTEINGLDERFFMGYEDTDLSAQISQRNQKIYIHPAAEIVHLFGQAKQLETAPQKVIYAWQAAPKEFLQKYYGNAAARNLVAQRLIDRVWRRLVPQSDKGRQLFPDKTGISIDWTGETNRTYFLELSNDQLFYDKFGVRVTGTHYSIDATILNRLEGHKWFWRVHLESQTFDNPIAFGWWKWNKQHNNT